MVRELKGSERVNEIARMLGGVEITEKTRAHALEMVKKHENSSGALAGSRQ